MVHWPPGATYELLVATLSLMVAYILPERGVLILIWTLIHILFVVSWRRLKPPHGSLTPTSTPSKGNVE